MKASGRARRHMRDCSACREYRGALRGMRRSFAALTPAGAGPLIALTKLLGIGGAGGAGAAGGSAAAGGAAAAGSSAAAAAGTVTACKVAAVVCTAAITAAGGAVEAKRLAREPSQPRHVVHAPAPLTPAARQAALHSAPAVAPAPIHRVVSAPARRQDAPPRGPPPRPRRDDRPGGRRDGAGADRAGARQRGRHLGSPAACSRPRSRSRTRPPTPSPSCR